MTIDIRTLIVILAITHLIQVMVFWLQYRTRHGYPGSGWWLLWCLAEAIGFFSFQLRTVPGLAPFAIVTQNTMLLGGVVFLYIGIRRFLGSKENARAIITGYCLWLAVFLYFLFVNDRINIRSFLICGGVTVMSWRAAAILFTRKLPSVAFTANALALTFLVYGVVMLIRIPFTIASGTQLDVFAPTPINIATYLSALLVGLLWTYGLILMLNQRLETDRSEAIERYEQIFRTTPDAVLITRLGDGMIIAVNQGFVAMTGHTREAAIGKSTFAINIWRYPADRERMARELHEQRVSNNFEAEFLCKDGRVVVGLMSSRIIDLGGVPHILSVTRDITARKRAEERIAQQLRELQQTHNAMLDREDRVQELKAEVNALLAKLGQPLKYGT
jgi:PAS domain S-box-containing protein